MPKSMGGPLEDIQTCMASMNVRKPPGHVPKMLLLTSGGQMRPSSAVSNPQKRGSTCIIGTVSVDQVPSFIDVWQLINCNRSAWPPSSLWMWLKCWHFMLHWSWNVASAEQLTLKTIPPACLKMGKKKRLQVSHLQEASQSYGWPAVLTRTSLPMTKMLLYNLINSLTIFCDNVLQMSCRCICIRFGVAWGPFFKQTHRQKSVCACPLQIRPGAPRTLELGSC